MNEEDSEESKKVLDYRRPQSNARYDLYVVLYLAIAAAGVIAIVYFMAIPSLN